MGKHSYKPEARNVSSFLPVESHQGRAHQRGLLGRIAIRTGGALAALTAAGVALFGVSQVNELTHREPVPVGYSASPNGGAQTGPMLREAIDEASEDFSHLMGALGAFTILTTAGIGLIAQQTSRRYYRRPQDEGEVISVVSPYDFADEDDPDMPSRIPVAPVVVYERQEHHDRSLIDDLFGEHELEESYA